MTEKSPNSQAKIQYDLACKCDSEGREQEAVQHYELALRQLSSLSDDDQRGLLLGLGSTYRCLGRYHESLATFDRAIEMFPDRREYLTFRALTKYNLGRASECIEDLLNLLVDTTKDEGILNYHRALRFYADKLDQTWTDPT
jgi:tetratricopeptide (TPR) repeat protein